MTDGETESPGEGGAPQDVEVAPVHCIYCEYDLRGLPADGRCPECGKPVSDSIATHLMMHSDPRWVRKLATAVSLVVGVFGLWLVSIGFASLIIWRPAWLSASDVRITSYLLRGLQLVSLPAQFVAAWMLTIPEPGVVEPEHITLRYGARWATIVSSGAYLAMVPVIYLGWFPRPYYLAHYLFIASDVLSAVAMILLAVHLKFLSDRLPARRAGKAVIWVGGILTLRMVMPIVNSLFRVRIGEDDSDAEQAAHVARIIYLYATPVAALVGVCVLPAIVSGLGKAARAGAAKVDLASVDAG